MSQAKYIIQKLVLIVINEPIIEPVVEEKLNELRQAKSEGARAKVDLSTPGGSLLSALKFAYAVIKEDLNSVVDEVEVSGPLYGPGIIILAAFKNNNKIPISAMPTANLILNRNSKSMKQIFDNFLQTKRHQFGYVYPNKDVYHDIHVTYIEQTEKLLRVIIGDKFTDEWKTFIKNSNKDSFMSAERAATEFKLFDLMYFKGKETKPKTPTKCDEVCDSCNGKENANLSQKNTKVFLKMQEEVTNEQMLSMMDIAPTQGLLIYKWALLHITVKKNTGEEVIPQKDLDKLAKYINEKIFPDEPAEPKTSPEVGNPKNKKENQKPQLKTLKKKISKKKIVKKNSAKKDTLNRK